MFLLEETSRDLEGNIPVESWCGTLGAMRRAWRGCLNVGTTGDSISTRRIHICHTVPWQPSYCLNSLNSGGMYCGVPEWKQIALLHLLPGCFLLEDDAHKTLQQYPHLGILRKVFVALQKQVQSQSTWLHQCTSTRIFSGLMSRCRTPVSSQLMLACRIWAKYCRASRSVSGRPRLSRSCMTSNRSLQTSVFSMT